MPELRPYGVECKNPACGERILLGEYMAQPERGRDFAWIDKPPGFVRCPRCGEFYEYGQDDLKGFPRPGGEE
jgi:hypothetical protein